MIRGRLGNEQRCKRCRRVETEGGEEVPRRCSVQSQFSRRGRHRLPAQGYLYVTNSSANWLRFSTTSVLFYAIPILLASFCSMTPTMNRGARIALARMSVAA